MWVYSVKDYVFGGKTVRKGGEDQYQWTLKRAADGKAAARVKKHRNTEYDKRTVLPDGSTFPVVLSEW